MKLHLRNASGKAACHVRGDSVRADEERWLKEPTWNRCIRCVNSTEGQQVIVRARQDAKRAPLVPPL